MPLKIKTGWNAALACSRLLFLGFFMVNLMLLIYRFKNRDSASLKHTSVLLAVNLGWFPLLPFFGALFCAGMLLTQFWQPMTVLGISASAQDQFSAAH
jgi:hypothetical protein